jgi:hypothetical protein
MQVQTSIDDIFYNISCNCKYCYNCAKEKQLKRNGKPFSRCLSSNLCNMKIMPGMVEEFIQIYESRMQSMGGN